MKIVLFRHAQKGLIPWSDPELTEIGFQQARRITAMVEKKALPKPTHVWVSPKIRAGQTLQNLCEHLKIPLQVHEDLDLRLDHEDRNLFKKRIQKSLDLLASMQKINSKDVYFLCTHYDWIEESMTLINCDKDLNSFEFSHWSPTQFLVFEILENHWKLLQKGSAHDAKFS